MNNSDQTLSWTLHTKAAGPFLDDGTFRFLHRTGSPFTPSSAGKKSVIPDITLDSGETFQLGVLFTPRECVFHIAFSHLKFSCVHGVPMKCRYPFA